MNINHFTLVTFQITGVYVLIRGIVIMGKTFYGASLLLKDSPYSWVFLLVTVIPFVLTMLIAFALFRKTRWLAEKVGASMDNENAADITTESFFRLMLAVMGVALLVEGLFWFTAVPQMFQNYFQVKDPKTSSQILNGTMLETSGLLVKMSLGLYFLFWSKGLVKWWSRNLRKQCLTCK